MYLSLWAKRGSSSGTILIVSLWILLILTVFALALGRSASLEIKLAGYQADALKAEELAKAAIEKAIWEKTNDATEQVDALSEPWANNETLFKDFELGAGSFSLTYPFDQVEEQEDLLLYGMEDEQGKININKVEEQVLINLLQNCGAEDAEALASAILIWSGQKEDLQDEEEGYYQTLELPYYCKKAKLESIPELLLLRGITTELLYAEEGLAQYLSLFGEGSVNINTAREKVLSALIGVDFPDLTRKIMAYRKGDDGKIATADDRWFAVEQEIFNIEGEAAKNLRASYAEARDDPFFDVTAAEWARLQALESGGKITVNSSRFTIHAQAEVRKVKKSIVATIGLSKPGQINYLFWHQN